MGRYGYTRVLVACSSAGSEGTNVIPAPMPTPASATQTSQYIWGPSSCCNMKAQVSRSVTAKRFGHT